MAVTRWLIDKSALVKMPRSPDSGLWGSRIARGLVNLTTVTALEVGFSARNGADVRIGAVTPPLSLMPLEYMTPAAERRAREVQVLLADQGLHRTPSIPDLLIAAVAELAGLVVLHDDKDFDIIAQISGQSMERLRVEVS
ncbi:MAG: PIN domain nuclease [Propionibacteriaceae bacterium]|jgi:predicted nucleic acid-binding protein|nr:PIN domain nuclease [Propionibacteriaceae bacterium]